MEAELIAHDELRNTVSRKSYTDAQKTANKGERSDANPILLRHPHIPFGGDVKLAMDEVKAVIHTKEPLPEDPCDAFAGSMLAKESWSTTLTSSHFPYRYWTPKEWGSNGEPIVVAALYEEHLTPMYRISLLKGPAGNIRHTLLARLPSELTITAKHTDPRTMKAWLWFPDRIYLPRAAMLPRAHYEGIIAELKLGKVLNAERDTIFKHLAKAQVCKLPSGRYAFGDAPVMDADVHDAAEELWHVSLISFSFPLF